MLDTTFRAIWRPQTLFAPRVLTVANFQLMPEAVFSTETAGARELEGGHALALCRQPELAMHAMSDNAS